MNKGFTFLEVIIASFLFAAIVGVVAAMAIFFFKNSSFSFEEGLQVDQVKTTITQMIRELRKAQIGADGSWPLVQTDDKTLVFYADINGDFQPDKIRYFMSGTDLKRGVIPPSGSPIGYPSQNETISTMASYVDATQSAIFKYYNGNWPADTTNNPLVANQRILNTRYIAITLRINRSTNFAAQPFELTGGVTLRNLKDNL